MLTSSQNGAGSKPGDFGFESRQPSSASGSTCVSAKENEIWQGRRTKFSPEIFKIVKVIHRRPRVVFKLDDLNGTPIDGQFYSEELTPVRITSRTTYKINKILDKRVRRGIQEVLVSWQGYGSEFDSWIPAASVKNI